MSYITLEDTKFVAESVASRSEGESHSLNSGSDCRYTYPDGSHCLVGAVSEGLGLPLPSVDSDVNSAGVDTYAGWLEDNHSISIDNEAVEFLSKIQGNADAGYYWPEAVAKAL